MRRARSALLVLLLLSLTVACTTTKVLQPKGEKKPVAAGASILLLPLDIELAELTAGGLTAPRADWTKAGREHLGAALEGRIAKGRAVVVPADPGLVGPDSPHLQIFKLHETVGASILQHQMGGGDGMQNLPTLKDRFDWTLGSGVSALAADARTDYALFVFVRDSYATAGRKAAMVGSMIACGLTRVCMPIGTGLTQAFASLVDLETGEIIWFNRLISETGDLREAESAAKSAEALLKGFPLS